MTVRLFLILALLAVFAVGCDGGGMKPAGGGGNTAPSGPVTGLLIVAQTVDGDTVDIAHETVITWNIVDQSGSKICGKDEIDPEFLERWCVGKIWQAFVGRHR